LIGVAAGSSAVDVKVGSLQRTITVRVEGAALAVPAGAGTATKLEIRPTTIELLPSEDVQLRLAFLKDDGSAAAPVSVSWQWLGAPGVAQVDATGRLVGIQPGNGIVEVSTATGLRARIQARVVAADWTFADPMLSLAPLTEDTIGITIPSQNNRRLDPAGFQWGSSNPNVAVVSPTGIVTAVAAGRADVVATGFGKTASIAVVVHREVVALDIRSLRGDTITIPFGGRAPFSAVPVAADDTPVPEAPVVWQVGDTSIVRYAVSDSAAVARNIGVTTLAVGSPGREPDKVWVLRVVPSGLVLDVERAGISLSSRLAIRASFADSSGRPIAPATGVTWSSSNPAVLQVDAGGNVTPTAFGRALVIAGTPWGNADTATVFVQGEVLFVSTRNGTPDIFAVDRTDPGRANEVIGGASTESWPAYSPDGTRLAFVSDRAGNAELYMADADGANITRLTQTVAAEAAPVWTPDGRHIVYQSDQSGSTQIWIVNADGTDARQLTQGSRPSAHPAIAPNGSTIAFTSTRDGNSEIYLMALDGTNQRNFTASPEAEQMPAWLGDSSVAFLVDDRESRGRLRSLVRMNFAREMMALTPQPREISGYALTAAGDLLALVLQMPGPTGRPTQAIFLLPLPTGTPAEILRQGDQDQLSMPAFRR
jgi:hypothetical protein